MSDITANVVIGMPSQLFTMPRQFKAVANGKIYIGQIDTDPVDPANQIQVYLENENGDHVPVAQPIIINTGGYPVYNGQIAKFVTVEGHSMAVYDAYGAQQFYFPNILKYDPDQLEQRLASGMDGEGDALIGVKQPYPNTVLRTQHDLNADYVNVKDWGAKGDGVTDDTAAIEAAWLAVTSKGSKYFPYHTGEYDWMSQNGPVLYFPAGRYIYNGAGLNLNDTVNQIPLFAIKGEGPTSTEIYMGATDTYLINSAVNPWGSQITDLKISGGLGAVKYTSTAQNQRRLTLYKNLIITAFRECGIGHSSQDWPYCKFHNIEFWPRTGYGTICILLSGWSAGSEIISCAWGLAESTGTYSYAVKLNIAAADAGGYRGPTTPILIADSGYYRRNSVDGSAGFWLVPNPSTNDNAGRAIVFRGNKFGAENMNINSYNVLIADESTGTGTWGGNRRHGTSLSSGYLRGVIFDKNNARFEGNATVPYIVSYTPHIQSFVCEDIIDNAMPANYIEYRGAGISNISFGKGDGNHLISTRYWLAPTATDYEARPVPYLSNFPHTIRIIDEMNYLNTSTSQTQPGDSSVVFANLMTVTNTASGIANALTKTVIDNSIGVPSEAVSLVASSSVGRITFPLSGWTANRNVWVEIELSRGDTNPIGSVVVEVVESDTVSYFRRVINVTSEWKMERFQMSIPDGATTVNLRVVSQGYKSGATTFKLGRVYAYHSSLPINTGNLRCIGSAWNTPHPTIGSYHLWVDGNGILRIKNGQPVSGTDGVAVGSQS